MVLIGPSGKPSRRGSGCVSGTEGCSPSRTSRSTIAMDLAPRLRALTNARQLISLQHVDDPAPAHARLEDQEAIGIVHDLPNDTRVAPLGSSAHGGQNIVRTLPRPHPQQLPPVGDIERIET